VVRANKRDVARADSEGDYYLRLYNLRQQWEREEEEGANKDSPANVDERFQSFYAEHLA
jgi:hypothetical protein